ncbi:MAG: N-acetyl-gamma-glutamyl-phosphate reductase [Eggerthellaceae bacterium]|jgi:N-acetyl-gamma-glutamyl-phosphate reductase
MTIRAGVVGAAGFAGIELVRILCQHPEFDLCAATSNELAGKKISSVYPAFTEITDLEFVAHGDKTLDTCDVVFLAVPHTAALKEAPPLVERGATVVDLSADFRLEDTAVYEEWYGVKHTAPDLLRERAFGLPELFHEGLDALAEKRKTGAGVLVGCAGCYPTATSLAAAPVLRANLSHDGLVVVDAISGVTGAGKKASLRTHFCFANENLEAYGVATHRHTPEIEQILDIPGRLIFTPHLAPLNRGLLSTVTIPLDSEIEFDQDKLDKLYSDFYSNKPFVKVLPRGVMPRTSSVAGSNYAHVGPVYNAKAHAVTVTCAIDNIGKGAAAQGVQCANIVCGLPETCGLESAALPV